MKRLNRTLRLLAVTAAALGTLLSTAPAQAINVTIDPAAQNINVGDTTWVDIIVSGLTDPVGGFSLVLGFNDAFLSLTNMDYTNDPDGKMGALPDDFSFGVSGGSLDLFFVADILETEASLALSQGASFRLATVQFTGFAAGLSPLTLTNVVLSNWDGTATLAGVTTQDGEICVGAPNGCERVVPEPGTLALLSLGMLGMGLARRRRST